MIQQNSTIFYVDDDRDDQLIFKECINIVRPDLICEFAFDGDEALAKLANPRFNPACIFIDLNMPGMNGNDLLKEIKSLARFADIPCFILSTSNHPKHVGNAISAGAERYLVKPAVYIDFKNLLQETLESAGANLR